MTEKPGLNERHQNRMQRKKEIVDKKIAEADKEQGVLIINTGNGKGKSSAAFGMLARALGHNMKAGVVQFIKGSFSTGEEAFFRRFPEVDYHVMGEGFTWETQDRDRDIKAAMAAWEKAKEMLNNEAYHLVILDELNIALKYKYIPIEDVIETLQNRPAMQHVVVTGRAAPKELIEIADTVTDMTLVKHAFQNGIKAQKGVEL
ncbi:MAG: cob(I)yrinic acid a,c-diamide adenosyltransferase [Gammaproteobacteria bacterium]|nr:cob(I)yrinic acid a,c-diamide adenosyltransferase [Gammaproteobacteria bacterium]